MVLRPKIILPAWKKLVLIRFSNQNENCRRDYYLYSNTSIEHYNQILTRVFLILPVSNLKEFVLLTKFKNLFKKTRDDYGKILQLAKVHFDASFQDLCFMLLQFWLRQVTCTGGSRAEISSPQWEKCLKIVFFAQFLVVKEEKDLSNSFLIGNFDIFGRLLGA